jgi:hypothetical protein
VALASLAAILSTGSQAQARFAVSADGQEVVDGQTKLTWRRCAEGMNWNGKTCAGKASKFTLTAAKKQAAIAATNGGPAWHLPTRDELVSLVEKGKTKPMIDAQAFPATPKAMFWATRPGYEDNLNAWLVHFGNGRVYGNPGSKAPLVRLVRTTN